MKAARFADSHATTVELVDDWRTRAACRGVDGEVFFPAEKDHIGAETAKSYCRTCTEVVRCLLAALDEEEQPGSYQREGVRGGLTAAERNQQFGKPKPRPRGRVAR